MRLLLKCADILVILIIVSVMLDLNLLFNGKVTGKILNTTREIHKSGNRTNKDKIINKDIMMNKKAMNLETMKSKLIDDDLYEHVSEKDNSVNERSFIFIHGSKFKIPHLNIRAHSKNVFKEPNYYRTFVSNFDSADGAKYDDTQQRYNNAPLIETAYKDTLAEGTNFPAYYPSNDLYYPKRFSNQIESEVSLLNKKVKAANGAIGEQYRDMKMKNDLVNMHSKYPGLLNVDENRKYPKDNQIKLKTKASKSDKILLKDVGINMDTQKEDKFKHIYVEPIRLYDPPMDKKSSAYLRNYPTSTSIQQDNLRRYMDYIKVSNLKPEYAEVTRKDSLIDTRPLISNMGKSTDGHREYIELLKPPILRAKVDLNSMFNKVNHKVSEKQYANPHYQNFKDYSINIPYRMKNDLQLQQKTMQDEISDNHIRTYSPLKHIDFYRDDSGEEPEFHDARLISKIEEMKKIDAAFQEENIPREPENPRELTIEKQVKNSQKVKSNPLLNKSSCVYPGCQLESREHYNKYLKTKLYKEKCKCASDKTKYKNTPFSSNIEPVTEKADSFTNRNIIRDEEKIIPQE